MERGLLAQNAVRMSIHLFEYVKLSLQRPNDDFRDVRKSRRFVVLGGQKSEEKTDGKVILADSKSDAKKKHLRQTNDGKEKMLMNFLYFTYCSMSTAWESNWLFLAVAIARVQSEFPLIYESLPPRGVKTHLLLRVVSTQMSRPKC